MADSKEEEEEPFQENPPEMDGVPDLSMLIYLHMKNVLHNLEYRYGKMSTKQCYTSISTILVAINPYERLPIYGPDVIEEFHTAAKKGVLPGNRPHPYGVSARSYMRMIQRKENQSVIVCGESGAGKTETTKLLMRYLAMTAPSASMDSSMVEKQIIAASPVLEAFGNAKTVMNNNSSRFGKFTKLLYDVPKGARDGSILGSYLETYLLEKSRVVFQSNNERNYHIFYFLHAGLKDDPQFKELSLSHCDKFWYTKQGKSSEVPGVNDVDLYIELEESLGLMRIDAEQRDLWRIVAGLLHMGNLEFKREGDGFASIKTPKVIETVAELWSVDPGKLTDRLTTTTIKIGKKTITKKVQFDDAPTNRDSITKGFYEQCFLFLCDRINAELYDADNDADEDDESSALTILFIGILDVFGFENFYINSLEQFCINFTNEKLQQFFNYHIIRSEQEEYIKEGVFWTPLDIPDNDDYMNMVEMDKKGFFTLLDSACKAPKPTVEAWQQELFKNWGDNPCIKKAKKPGAGNARGAPKKKGKGSSRARFDGFTITHFADMVCYDAQNFLIKNMEAVHPDTAKMLGGSANALVSQIGTLGTGGKKKKKKLSVTGVFHKGIKMLMKNLKRTEPFFVRCVNPNSIKSKEYWDEVVMEGQLRCGGLVEALKVLKLGYPTRVQYSMLYDKYHSTVTNPLIKNMGPEAFSTALLIGFDVNEDDYELGLTKIFFKPAKAAVLDKIMSAAGKPLSPEQNEKITKWVVQKRLKQMVGCSKAFVELRNRVRLVRAAKKWETVGRVAAIVSHTMVRHLKMARANIMERKRQEAATAMQTYFRSCYERERYHSKLPKYKKSTKMLWKSYRRWNERRALAAWLDVKVAETRKRKAEEERKRKEEEARRSAEEKKRQAEELRRQKEMERAAEADKLRLEAEAKREAERLAREEAERKAAEEAAAKKAEEERIAAEKARLAEEEAKRAEEERIAAEAKAAEEEAARAELEAAKEVARKKIETGSANVEKAKLERERKKRDKKKLDRETSLKKTRKKREKTRRKRRDDEEEAYMREQFPEQYDSDEEEERPRRKKKKKKAKKAAKYSSDEDSDYEDDYEESESEEEEDPRTAVANALKKFDRIAMTGQLFMKYTGKRRRKPQDRIIKVTFDSMGSPLKIAWGSGSRHIEFRDIMYIAHGHWTPVFQARKDKLDPKVCFSVVGKAQILDLQAPSKVMALVWVKGLRRLIGQSDDTADRLARDNLERLLDEGEAKKRKGDTKDHKRRAKSLMLLQQDLFVMTTTTVFRNLEEERIWDIDQSVRDKFNAKILYEEALREDVPWRQWTQWIRDKIVAYLHETGRVHVTSGGGGGGRFGAPMGGGRSSMAGGMAAGMGGMAAGGMAAGGMGAGGMAAGGMYGGAPAATGGGMYGGVAATAGYGGGAPAATGGRSSRVMGPMGAQAAPGYGMPAAGGGMAAGGMYGGAAPAMGGGAAMGGMGAAPMGGAPMGGAAGAGAGAGAAGAGGAPGSADDPCCLM